MLSIAEYFLAVRNIMSSNPSFLKRMGYAKPLPIQLESCDEFLRTDLYNIYLEFEKLDSKLHFIPPRHDEMKKYLWAQYFRKPSDEYRESQYALQVKALFSRGPWFDAYDFLEVVLSTARATRTGSSVLQAMQFLAKVPRIINSELEKNNSAYRFLEKEFLFVPISSEIELDEIQSALSTSKNQYDGAYQHLEAAIKFYADREQPDYRNSIKESISAVESLCVIICGGEAKTLGDALKKINNDGYHEIPKVLSKAFSTLYGFTNDYGGIRHALTEEGRTVTHEDARFMIVACSAFVNYLIVKIDNTKA